MKRAVEIRITIPLGKVFELEAYLLKERDDKQQIVLIQKSGVEINKVSSDKTEKIKAKFYTVILNTNPETAREFIRLLFVNGIVPEGREWMVYGPRQVQLL